MARHTGCVELPIGFEFPEGEEVRIAGRVRIRGSGGRRIYMSNKIDIKSVFLGVAIGVGALLCLGAETTHPSGGRFQLLGTEGILFKIDTTTGQVWKADVRGTDKEFMKANLGN